MQKKKNSNIFFKMAAMAAILDFGPSPKFNGMILGPYQTPPPSFVEIRRGVFPEYCSQTNKQIKVLYRATLAKIRNCVIYT